MWENVAASSRPSHRGDCEVRSHRGITRRHLRNKWASVRFKPTPACGPTCERRKTQAQCVVSCAAGVNLRNGSGAFASQTRFHCSLTSFFPSKLGSRDLALQGERRVEGWDVTPVGAHAFPNSYHWTNSIGNGNNDTLQLCTNHQVHVRATGHLTEGGRGPLITSYHPAGARHPMRGMRMRRLTEEHKKSDTQNSPDGLLLPAAASLLRHPVSISAPLCGDPSRCGTHTTVASTCRSRFSKVQTADNDFGRDFVSGFLAHSLRSVVAKFAATPTCVQRRRQWEPFCLGGFGFGSFATKAHQEMCPHHPLGGTWWQRRCHQRTQRRPNVPVLMEKRRSISGSPCFPPPPCRIVCVSPDESLDK